MKKVIKSISSQNNEAVDPYWDTSRHGTDDIKCDNCGNDSFKVIERLGGGGSGTFLKLTCTDCGTAKEMDFENPYYEG